MARTKASVGAKVSFGKSSKGQKNSPRPTPSDSGRGKSSSKPSWSGGNSYCPRETPDWQRPITNFFKDTQTDRGGESSSSNRPRKKINVVDSETESENENVETARKAEESADVDSDGTDDGEIELPPLADDNSSRKIEEYFVRTESRGRASGGPEGDAPTKGPKNKGEGKSSAKGKSQNGGLGGNKENRRPDGAKASASEGPTRKRSVESIEGGNGEREVKKIKI